MSDTKYPAIDYGGKNSSIRTEAEIQPSEVPLGIVLLRNLWTSTRGSLTVDLKRPTVPRQAATPTSLFTYRREEAPGRGAPPTRPRGAFVSSGARLAPRPYTGEPLAVVPFSDSGARVKLMRHVHLGKEYEGVSATGGRKRFPALDLGLGFNLELDTAELQPQARMKLWDFLSLRALPHPSLKVSKRLALPRGDGGGEGEGEGARQDGGWGVRLSYDCPLRSLDRFWEPGAGRLMVSVDNLSNNGLRLTQGGVEFNGRVNFAEGNLMIRGQGRVDFPQQIPVEEGQPLLNYEVRRLGMKANW